MRPYLIGALVGIAGSLPAGVLRVLGSGERSDRRIQQSLGDLMSAVETGERIGLPQNTPSAERMSLPMAAPSPPEPAAAVELTQRAARAFGEILAGKGESYGALKVAVMGGGCAGNQYAMAIARAPEPTDIVLESRGIDIYLDSSSAHMMVGAEIDFIDSMMGRGFTVRNPSAEQTCGCGSSFNTNGGGVKPGGCTA